MRLCRWDAVTGKKLRSFKGHQGPVQAVVMVSDTMVSGGWDGTLRSWDLDAGKVMDTKTEHLDAIYALLPTGDKRGCFSGSEDCTVRQWTVTPLGGLQCVMKFEGHTARVNCLALCPQSGLLFSGGDDKAIRAWHVPSGGCIQVRTVPYTQHRLFLGRF